MILFWTIAITMIAGAIAFISPALLRRQDSENNRQKRSDQNIAIAREHLADLDTELANGTLSQDLYAESKLEIEQTLLLDLERRGTAAPKVSTDISGRRALMTLVILIPLTTVALYQQLGTPNIIEDQQILAHSPDLDAPSLQEIVKKFRQRLEKNPEDAEGWYLLGRTLMTMREYAAAAQAYENSYQLSGDVPAVMLALADATAMAQGGSMDGKPAKLVFDAIAIDPSNITGLWMAGVIAEGQGQYEKALNLWLRLRPLVSGMPDELAQLDTLIHRVAAGLGKDASTLITTTPAPGGDVREMGAEVRVTIKLDDALYAKVSGEETVFVYLKAMQGPSTPVAAVRYKVKDLPVSISLNDSHSVMSKIKLSSFKEVRVGARVSYSGDAIAQSGDLVGEITNVLVGEKPVTVIIDKASP